MTKRDELARLEEKLKKTCGEQGLFLPGDRVLAACSGGQDSMALLLFLYRRGRELGLGELAVCHVNHGLRGEKADADEAFVRRAAARLGLRLFVTGPDAMGEPVPQKAGEAWARTLRYKAFHRTAEALRREGGTRVVLALAHTATDQAETVLLHLARGAGLQGAGGMRPKTQAPFGEGQAPLPLVRPLLPLSRRDTEAYCGALGEAFVTDETNLGPLYARNRVRQNVLPVLATVNPQAEQALVRFALEARRAGDYLAREAQALLASARRGENSFSRGTLLAADTVLLEEALYLLLSPVRDPEMSSVEAMAALVRRGAGALQLTPRMRWLAQGDVLRLEEQKEEAPGFAPFPLAEGRFELPGGVLEARCAAAPPAGKGYKFAADYDKIKKGVVIRTRQPGDVFHPAGRKGGKTLKKFLNEAKIPPSLRAGLPVAARGSVILWVAGQGFAAEAAAGEGTARFLTLAWAEKA